MSETTKTTKTILNLKSLIVLCLVTATGLYLAETVNFTSTTLFKGKTILNMFITFFTMFVITFGVGMLLLGGEKGEGPDYIFKTEEKTKQ